MTSTDQPGPPGAATSNPYAVPSHPPPYAAQHPQQQPQQQPWAAARPRRTSPLVAVLLTVAGTLLAPLGYLLAAKGGERPLPARGDDDAGRRRPGRPDPPAPAGGPAARGRRAERGVDAARRRARS